MVDRLGSLGFETDQLFVTFAAFVDTDPHEHLAIGHCGTRVRVITQLISGNQLKGVVFIFEDKRFTV